MLRGFWLTPIVALFLVTAAQAQFKQGDWELTLNGSGANGPDFDGVSAAASGGLGYFLADQIELGVRQTVIYSDIGSSGNLNGSTRIFADWNFDIGRIVPYLGGQVGYAYGDSVNDTFQGGPEGGVKFFVNATTFIFLSAEYQFFFNNGDNVADQFSDGQFIYGLGIGFRF